MVEIVAPEDAAALANAGRLLHDFNVEYDEPTPSPADLTTRLAELVAGDHVVVLLAREADDPVGIAIVRLQPSIWSQGHEAYLAELYVVPAHRGQGHGRALITETLQHAHDRGADYAYVITSEDDHSAQRLYAAAGFRRTEGEGGPLMLAYERDL